MLHVLSSTKIILKTNYIREKKKKQQIYLTAACFSLGKKGVDRGP
jgi:hypothetical protein